MRTIHYDLSELFLSSGEKFKYYGISRTVMEVGYELAMMDDVSVRFVVFSPARKRFFEVSPRIGASSPNGVIDLGFPQSAKPTRTRSSFPKPNRMRDLVLPAVRWVANQVNERRWRTVPADLVRDIDLNGQTLVSLGRPKMIADYMTVTCQAGIRIKLVPLLHDMIPLYEFSHPSQSMFSNHFTHDNHIVIRGADLILTNSAFTKAEIERFSKSGHLPPVPQVVAVPLSHEFRSTNEPVVKTGPSEPYLLCTGVMTGRKNLECVLDAMMHLHETGRPVPPLVLAGALRKRTRKYVKKARFDPIRAQIHFVVNPNQAELRALYENAFLFLMPSRLEGWGLPLGEALWLGTPALASTAAVLKEVGGDLAEYFDPDDPQELSALIVRLQSDPEAYNALKVRIEAHHDTLRTWKNVAEDILAAVKAAS
jgi:glycosyltransferase involved in cell wall biosynthesis